MLGSVGAWYPGPGAGEEAFLEVFMAAGWTGPGSFGLGFCDEVGALAVEELGDCYLEGVWIRFSPFVLGTKTPQ